MMRRILAIALIVLAIVLVAVISLLIYPPTATRVTSWFSPMPPPTPILTARGTPPAVQATSAYVLDADTGSMLVNTNGQQHLPMASTTKIMTAIIAIEKADLNQIVTIKQDAVDEVKKYNGSSAQLVVGDQIRMKDLLYALMLPSGDDAAITVAETVSGTPADFVTTMNLYAKRLHLTQTHYVNPDGLTYLTPQGQPDPNHYTTAADLAHLTRYAMSNPLFAQIVQLQHYILPATSVHHKYDWATTNTMLSSYAGATGIKTGYTVEAGYCLVFSATSGGHHLIGVLLQDKDADQRFTDAKVLLDWAFALPLLPPPTPTS